jgi:adenylate kinase
MIGGVIFIAGVHGAGKGTLAEQVSKKTGINVFTASGLITARKQAPVDHQKNVIDAKENQEYLVSAVLEKAETHELFILDGHFSLWSRQSILPIPISVFQRLPIRGIVLVEESSEIVMSRLVERDGSSKTIEQISKALKQEKEHSILVQKKLGIPMLIVNSDQSCQVSNWIQSNIN